MAERKVFNKYFSPDFDPRFLPKGERPANNQLKLRNMLPMTICCTTCGEYMGRGTKFNSRQEIAQGMDWKGIKRWRFYVKCSSCSSEMTFLTDPENDHYVPEHGCSSMTEPWRAKIEAEEAYIKSREDEEFGDAMKALENRSKETKYQLDLMDTINDLQDINKQHRFMDMDKVIETLHNDQKNTTTKILNQQEIEEKLLNEYKCHQSKRRKLNGSNNGFSLLIEKNGNGVISTKTIDSTTANVTNTTNTSNITNTTNAANATNTANITNTTNATNTANATNLNANTIIDTNTVSETNVNGSTNTDTTTNEEESHPVGTNVQYVFRFGANTSDDKKQDQKKDNLAVQKRVDNHDVIVTKKRKKTKKTKTKENVEKKQT